MQKVHHVFTRRVQELLAVAGLGKTIVASSMYNMYMLILVPLSYASPIAKGILRLNISAVSHVAYRDRL